MKYYSGNGETNGSLGGTESKRIWLDRRRFPRQEFLALNSATGGAGPLGIITTPLTQPINIVSVTVDARDRDDENQNGGLVRILLIFTAILNLPLDAVVVFNFQLIRSSQETTTPIGPTFTFSKTVAVLAAESFAFQFFDSDLDPGTYTYTVTLSPGSLIAVTPGATIANATLSAIAVAAE